MGHLPPPEEELEESAAFEPPSPNPNPNPSPNPDPDPDPDPNPHPSQALTVLLGSLLAVPIFWATDTFLSA